MELMPIFVDKGTLKGLHSICLRKDSRSEFDLLLDRLTNIAYVQRYCKDNIEYLNRGFFGQISLEDAIREIRKDVKEMVVRLQTAAVSDRGTGRNRLEQLFRPLHNLDAGVRELQSHKFKPGKISKVRLYAIRISEDMFVATGGAIKLTHLMEQHPDTVLEKKKIDRIKTWLKAAGICDEDSLIYYYEEQGE
jgi:hypothetical protein